MVLIVVNISRGKVSDVLNYLPMEKADITDGYGDPHHAPTHKSCTCIDLDLMQKCIKISAMCLDVMEAMYPICVLLESHVMYKDAVRTKK